MGTDDFDVLPDGLPKILPPSEDGVFQAVLTLPEANVALVSAVAAFIGRPVKSATLRNNDAPIRDASAKREEYDVNCVIDGEDGDQCAVEMQSSAMEGDSKLNDHRNIKWRRVKFVLTQGSQAGAMAHVLRAKCKALVRLLYRHSYQGHEVDSILFDFANLLSGYFFFLALKLNALDGVGEIEYVSRNY